MATIVIYDPTNRDRLDWFSRCGEAGNLSKDKVSILRTEITEVEIAGGYNSSGNYIEWDASEEENGSVMAYLEGTKVTLVPDDDITTIPSWMFNKFMSLRELKGFGTITEIGAWAFYSTPCIELVDIIPSQLTSIGNDAFRLSCIEDATVVDQSEEVYKTFTQYELNCKPGDRATRSKRWPTALKSVADVTFPIKKILFDVPNSESQLDYAGEEYPYATVEGVVKDMASSACRTFSCYHIWNALYAGTANEYPNFMSWFEEKLNSNGNYAETTSMSEADRQRDYERLGWTWNYVSTNIESADQLTYIVGKLSEGFPVQATIMSNSEGGYHAVAIIGCDPDTHKLAIIDSAKKHGSGMVFWMRYEDLFVEGTTEVNEVLRVLDYKLPILAPSDTWFTGRAPAGMVRASITEIKIAGSHTATEGEQYWDASADRNGSVKVYMNGTKLTIVGNGCVFANPDSSYVFSDRDKNRKDYYSNLTKIDGGEYFATHLAELMNHICSNCSALERLNTGNWNTSKVTTLMASFQNNTNLEELDVSNWDTSSVTSLYGFMNHKAAQANHKLKRLDVSNWDVSNVENMQAMVTNLTALKELDISKWNPTKLKNATQMVAGCLSLKVLDFTNWNTPKLQTASDMFGTINNFEKITIGENFSMGDAVFPTPSLDFPLADGNWYDSDHNAYAPEDVPGNVARTYYASPLIAVGDDPELVLMKQGTLRQIAFAIRYVNGKSNQMIPTKFAEEILALKQETEV